MYFFRCLDHIVIVGFPRNYFSLDNKESAQVVLVLETDNYVLFISFSSSCFELRLVPPIYSEVVYKNHSTEEGPYSMPSLSAIDSISWNN